MPELPEVECLVRGLRQRIVGWRVEKVRFFRDSLRERLDQKEITASLADRSIETVARRGKYLLISTDSTDGVIMHLGMTGNLILSSVSEQLTKHAHVILDLKRARKSMFLQFVDQRRFGRLSFFRSDYMKHPWLADLGVEPLSHQSLGQYLWQKSRNKKTAIKNFIMDARIITGVGNIYACETLHRVKIDPFNPAEAVSRPQYQALAEAIKATLQEAIAAGGTSFRDYKDLAGNPGYFSVNLAVYGKKNSPCPVCRTAISSEKLGGRSTFYCPSCQQ